MTPAEQAEIDRKRREREDELILLLLLILASGIESESFPAFSLFLSLHGTREIAESMADAHLDGHAVYGTRNAPSRAYLARRYNRSAAAMVAAMLATVQGQGDVALPEALRLSGYSRTDTSGLELGAERQIVTASNAGLITGAASIGILTALRHRSVLDERTTKICEERNGLTLAVDNPYWRSNFPSLHFHCRSIIEPVTGRFTASTTLPRTPPDPGFGEMPEIVRESLGL